MRFPSLVLFCAVLGGCASAAIDEANPDAGAGQGGPVRDMRIVPCQGHDVMNDVKNCGACGRVCMLDNVAMQGCKAGACIVGTCNPNTFDVDGKPDNGCECKPEPTDKATSTCAGAAMVSNVDDSAPAKLEIIGNIVPLGNEDWYEVRAKDDPDADGVCNRYNLTIKLATNPQDQFRFDVVTECDKPAECGAMTEKPTGLTSYDWSSSGAENGGECPCYAMDPPPDGGHVCADHSQLLRIRVYRQTQAPYTCDNYKIVVTNGTL